MGREMAGRNDPCPCGSGKKFKKCCQNNQVVSIEQMLYEECMHVTGHMAAYALEAGGLVPEREYRDLVKRLPNITILDELIEFLFPVWKMCFDRDRNNETMLEWFISMHAADISRERTRRTVESWASGARVVAGIVQKADEIAIEVKLTLTGETVQVKADELLAERGQLLIAITLPFQENWIFFIVPITYPSELADSAEQKIKNLFKESGEESPDLFLEQNFFDVIHVLYQIDDESLWWDPRHEEVYHRFMDYMIEQGVEEETVSNAAVLWAAYCNYKDPQPRNTGIYAAAVYYFFSSEFGAVPAVTQKELGRVFNTSPNSISTRANELADFYYDVMLAMEEPKQQADPMLVSERAMWEMTERMSEQDFADDQEAMQFANLHMNEPFEPKTDEQRAQALMYEAMIDQGEDLPDKTKKALALDPDSVDAYAMYAEWALDFDKIEMYWKKALAAGERKLGKDYFKENEGNFWMDVKTRPYMRAKLSYVFFLQRCGEHEEAARHLEDMLRLNPNDNQGARNLLLVEYGWLKEWEKADQLLKQYTGGFIGEAYYHVLFELLENGPTGKAKRLWKKAVKALPNIKVYLTGAVPLPPAASYYQLGSEEEAVMFVYDTKGLWKQPNAIAFLDQVE